MLAYQRLGRRLEAEQGAYEEISEVGLIVSLIHELGFDSVEGFELFTEEVFKITSPKALELAIGFLTARQFVVNFTDIKFTTALPHSQKEVLETALADHLKYVKRDLNALLAISNFRDLYADKTRFIPETIRNKGKIILKGFFGGLALSETELPLVINEMTKNEKFLAFFLDCQSDERIIELINFLNDYKGNKDVAATLVKMIIDHFSDNQQRPKMASLIIKEIPSGLIGEINQIPKHHPQQTSKNINRVAELEGQILQAKSNLDEMSNKMVAQAKSASDQLSAKNAEHLATRQELEELQGIFKEKQQQITKITQELKNLRGKQGAAKKIQQELEVTIKRKDDLTLDLLKGTHFLNKHHPSNSSANSVS